MPRRALTAIAVERMRPPARGQVELFDKGHPALFLRVSYGGGKAWGMFYRYDGKLRRVTFGYYPAMTLAMAREAWRETRRLIAMGQDPAPAKIRTGDTVATVVADWLKRDKRDVRASTLYQMGRALRRDVLPVWGNRPIRTISKRDVHELLDGIVDRGAPGMARSVHAYLRSLFKWAVGREILSVDPTAGVEKPAAAGKRSRALSDNELCAVWKAAGADPYGDIVRLLILTGARREEITRLRWSEIVDDTISLPADRCKTGAPRLIPLSPQAMALLAGVKPNGPFVFGAPKAWHRAKARIDAATRLNEPWVIHDLRRSVATGLQRLGVGLQVVEAVLGHAGTRAGIVGIYQVHDFLDEKKAALGLWGAHVGGLVAGRAPGKVLPLRGQQ
jgi:integrase